MADLLDEFKGSFYVNVVAVDALLGEGALRSLEHCRELILRRHIKEACDVPHSRNDLLNL